ncbi:hypothetical protein GCM10007160_19990 [Litchfieldella qijiaojingensis]|uniref:Uncharacterized protein n=1 Tax=Litchfieldella qijiaojingensis TaxID=980347 RepID=A0ABQ2YTZ5_9GAMM|nr:hypothetical protein [Halomonas qijiaojingensis]GGX92376.1 hypothetical protein GCM10007160_19990 [Halomonas qijiaojingensis]
MVSPPERREDKSLHGALNRVKYIYLIPRGLDKSTFIATSVVTFTCVNLLKLAPYLWLGEINVSSAWASSILAMAIVGVQLIFRALE